MPRTKNFSQEFLKELHHIAKDILFVYRNFLHWNISKFFIIVWGITLGVIFTLPFFLSSLIYGLIDPISWLSIVEYTLTGQDQTFNLVENLAEHPVWFVGMLFLLWVCALFFVLASSYSFLLFIKLYLSYVQKEPIHYKKNVYFSQKHIFHFMALLCWNFVYILAPAFIIFSCILGIYILSVKSTIPLLGATYIMSGILALWMIVISFISYKIIFSYILFAKEDDIKDLESAREYIQKSCKITSLKNYGKFVFVLVSFSLLMLPFQSIEKNLDTTSTTLRDAFVFKSGSVDTMEPQKVKYYEYISKEYAEVSKEEILLKIQMFQYFKMFFILFHFLFLNSLFVLVLVSFYKRVLDKK